MIMALSIGKTALGSNQAKVQGNPLKNHTNTGQRRTEWANN